MVLSSLLVTGPCYVAGRLLIPEARRERAGSQLVSGRSGRRTALRHCDSRLGPQALLSPMFQVQSSRDSPPSAHTLTLTPRQAGPGPGHHRCHCVKSAWVSPTAYFLLPGWLLSRHRRDGVPGVLLPAHLGHAAVDRGKHASPNCKATSQLRSPGFNSCQTPS